MQGHDDSAYRLLGANDENFDRFPIRLGIAVELESEFDVDLTLACCGMVRRGKEGLGLHGEKCQPLGRFDRLYPA
jgi:hypothetical protein